MKKLGMIFGTLVIAALLVGFTGHPGNNADAYTASITLTADGTGSLTGELNGFYPHQIEYLSVGDAAFTIVWYSDLGAVIATTTATIGTAGDTYIVPGKPPIMTGIPTYALSDFAGSTIEIRFTGVR